MDNFKVIYRILKHLEAMMDVFEPDMSPPDYSGKSWNIIGHLEN